MVFSSQIFVFQRAKMVHPGNLRRRLSPVVYIERRIWAETRRQRNQCRKIDILDILDILERKRCNKHKQDAEKLTKMRTLKAIWRDFIANFSSHGLRRVFDPIGTSPTLISRCFRLIWFFAWVSAAYFTISHMGQTVQQYLRYQTITSTHIRRGDPIKFPTVTFCPGHSLSINHAIFWATKNCNSSINKTDDTIAICGTFNNLLAGKDVKSWKIRAKLNVNLNTVIMRKSFNKFPRMVKNWVVR